MEENKKVVAFKFFKNSEEFEQWQLEEPRLLHQVQPITYNLDIKMEDASVTNSNTELLFGISVFYIKEIKTVD